MQERDHPATIPVPRAKKSINTLLVSANGTEPGMCLRDFSRRLVGDDISAMRRQPEEANAFKDDDNFILRF